MLFRWANGNLREFWESDPSPEQSHSQVRWMLAQLCGIADGLRNIHGKIPSSKLSTNEKTAGRHGDIKPENILWLRHDGSNNTHLLISDFGLTRFHSHESQSEGRHPGALPATGRPSMISTGPQFR